MPRISRADPTDPAWDAFVAQHPLARFSHLSGWQEMLRRTHRCEGRHLAAYRDDGTIAGVLPLVRRSGLVRRNRWSSLPAQATGGPLAHDEEVARALMAAALEQARAEGAGVLAIRADTPGLADGLDGLIQRDNNPPHVLPLPDAPEALRKAVSRSVWRRVKRAHEGGVTVREGRGREDLRAFYALYLAGMRRLRVLPKPFGLFTALAAHPGAGARFQLLIAEHGGRTIGGLVCFAFRDRLLHGYIGTDEACRDLSPDHALYWRACELAIEAGLTESDFDEAEPGSSLAHFKERWGGEPQPRWIYQLGSEQPAAGSAPAGFEQSPLGGPRAARLWDRTPLAVTRAAGAVVARVL